MRRLMFVPALVLLVVACADASAPSDVPARTQGAPVAPATEPPVAFVGAERLAPFLPARPPVQPDLAADFRAVLVADHCSARELLAPPASDVIFTVLDRSYGLAAGYVPADLVPASTAGFEGASGTRLVRRLVVDDLAVLRAAAVEAGLDIQIDSAYRSHADQAATFALWAARLGTAAAAQRTAPPGHSEHQLGTALDLTSRGWTGRFGDWATESAEGAWMAAHGWEYGFVMSYPADAEAQTCFGYEPWHYRWVGREAAAAHRESGVPLRQFLERYIDG